MTTKKQKKLASLIRRDLKELILKENIVAVLYVAMGTRVGSILYKLINQLNTAKSEIK